MIDLQLQEFITHVTRWHSHQVAQLQSIIDTPEDTAIQLGTGDDAIVLNGEKAQGFRAAIHVALSLIGNLPFHIETEGADEVPASLKDVPGLQVIDTSTGLPKASD